MPLLRAALPRPFTLAGLPLFAVCAALAACGGNADDAVADNACARLTDGGAVVVGSGLPGDPAIPEPASGYRLGLKPVSARNYMVVSANPLASQAGCQILKSGGSAVDAAVAVQAVLGLVEPQSSGLGGGAFLLHYNAQTKAVQAYDGREQAPSAATPDYLRYIGGGNTAYPLPTPAGTASDGAAFAGVRASGRSVGTPGAVRMLELAHRDHGKLAWSQLFGSGVKLATDGFKISGRLADAIAANRSQLLVDAEATALYFGAAPDYAPKALGTTLTNPAYAATLNALASGGANALYTGPIAQAIVDKIQATAGSGPNAVALTPGLTTMTDLANYQAVKREPVCTSYRRWVVCGMPPPSSGGIAVAQVLGILENYNLPGFGPTTIDAEGGKPSVMGVHLVAEAERLAYADRNKYVADTDFVPLPGGSTAALLSKDYLRTRASLIRFDRSMGTAAAGEFPGFVPQGSSDAEGRGTTHMTIVDRNGNVVVMTTTVESSMGSWRMARGFLLNNQLTDFSFSPSDAAGPIANRVGPLKRPRSSMAPTLVFERATDGSRGAFVMGTGSPGGATIIQFAVKTLVGVLDWGLDAQQATSMVNFGAANSPTTGIGGEHPNVIATNNGATDPLVTGLRALGHTVSVAAQSSGTSTIVRTTVGGSPGYVGGADPRREGLALGDTP
ncbi:gamma-glutamyltransferase family protein [Piscinibacter sakaiensis]|uniref:Gamma-glutamyltranspeptidase n=1 Tax=Piscinibacter sakaiensis TaxID=1547922 RepID=A0A0K8P8G4_PISS1|nr:gamma-glutamyltransferase family protein [Piscinibacter sakaiensis]GAP38799.1 gamma-glutamyltranspeptidase [Piscinibacter sakaiensis]